MFAYIEGTVDEILDSGIVLDHDGMGYEITMPSSDLNRLPSKNMPFRVYTSFNVSENGVALYGFLGRDTKELFLLLLTVNGVGPKAACAILGTLSSDDLRFAIIGEDVKALSAAPGIGPKTAKRIILDLKDKIDVKETVENRLSEGVGPIEASAKGDATEALVALGYGASDVLRAFSKMDMPLEATAEDWIREALKRM